MQAWLTEIVSEVGNFNISYYALAILIILGALVFILSLKGN